MAAKEVASSACVECGALYEHDPASGLAFCPICVWLAEEADSVESEEDE